MKIRPVHHAILCYLEWHCDRGIPFRTHKRMAEDLARNLTEVARATRDLVAWGLVSFRHDEFNEWHTVRLGDGRETPPISTKRRNVITLKTPAVHKGQAVADSVEWQASNSRAAA